MALADVEAPTWEIFIAFNDVFGREKKVLIKSLKRFSHGILGGLKFQFVAHGAKRSLVAKTYIFDWNELRQAEAPSERQENGYWIRIFELTVLRF